MLPSASLSLGFGRCAARLRLAVASRSCPLRHAPCSLRRPPDLRPLASRRKSARFAPSLIRCFASWILLIVCSLPARSVTFLALPCTGRRTFAGPSALGVTVLRARALPSLIRCFASWILLIVCLVAMVQAQGPCASLLAVFFLCVMPLRRLPSWQLRSLWQGSWRPSALPPRGWQQGSERPAPSRPLHCASRAGALPSLLPCSMATSRFCSTFQGIYIFCR